MRYGKKLPSAKIGKGGFVPAAHVEVLETIRDETVSVSFGWLQAFLWPLWWVGRDPKMPIY
jgi:hypothetical protein